MTSTTTESGIKAGSVITARTSDTNNVVWFYVIAPLPEGKVFGVNCGGDSSMVSPEGSGFRFDTATGQNYASPQTLARLAPVVQEALATFLVGAGLPDPRTSGEAPTPTPDQSDAVATAVGEAEERHRAWVDRLVSDAHEFADENSLCSEFDRFMREHGLPEREREREIEYVLTITYSGAATVAASNEDDAWETFSEDPFAFISRSDVTTYGDVDVQPAY